MTQEFVYCPTDEDSFDNLEDAVAFVGNHASNLDDAIGWVIEVNKKLPATHSSFVDGSGIAEYITERATDEYGEFAEDYLSDVICDEDLQRYLENIIIEFLNDHAKQPTFWMVGENVDNIIVDRELLDKYGVEF